MNLLSIQGHFAPAFRLNTIQATECKKQVETLSQEPACIISSKFRTDILYFDEDSHVEEILRTWCKLCGVTYKETTKLKFFCSNDIAVSLTQFFYRLQLLHRMPQWHSMYYKELLSMWIENPKEPILYSLNKIMILMNESNNEHSLKLNNDKFQQIVAKFIDLGNLTSLNKKNVN